MLPGDKSYPDYHAGTHNCGYKLHTQKSGMRATPHIPGNCVFFFFPVDSGQDSVRPLGIGFGPDSAVNPLQQHPARIPQQHHSPHRAEQLATDSDDLGKA